MVRTERVFSSWVMKAPGIPIRRDGGCDDEFTARLKSSEEQRAVEDGIVRGNHNVSRGDGGTVLRGHPARLALIEPSHPTACEDLAAVGDQILGQGEQVLTRVEPRLVLDPDCAGDLERQTGLGDERGVQPVLRVSSSRGSYGP